jgi:hypothetical protein
MSRRFARASKGERVYSLRPGKRYKRLNIVAGQIGNEVVAPCCYEWSTTSGWFEVWFEWHFCPKLPASCLIIMDNARFHRKIELEKISRFYGHTILWLPTYSPDKNRIETLWANLKNWLRAYAHLYPSIQDAVRKYLK